MLAALLLASITAAPDRVPAAGSEPAHAPVEAALLRAAYPDADEVSGRLGHREGVLVARSSACAADGTCILAVAASDGRSGAEASRGHAWTSFFAFRPDRGGWAEAGFAAGPVMGTSGRWRIGVAVLVDRDGPFVAVTTSTGGGEEGEAAATHLWSWSGAAFLPVLTAASSRQGRTETEAGFALCADRPGDRPSWEVRTRQREGRGPWTDGQVRVAWSGKAWVERPADRPCLDRGAPAPAAAAGPPAVVRVKSASASRTLAAPKGRPQATAPANAVDGDPQTAWVAGGKKGGVGAWLQVDLAAPATLGSLLLRAACPGADWKAGPRIKRIRLRFEDGPAEEATLADLPTPQAVPVARRAPARWFRVELLELYRGGRRQDACLTEVTPRAR